MSRNFGSNLELRSTREQKDPIRGLTKVRTYEGTEAAVVGLITTLTSDQSYVLDDTDAPLWRCVVSTPDDDTKTSNQTVDSATWELLGNDLQKDILEHPLSLSLDQDLIYVIRSGLDEVTAKRLTPAAALSNLNNFIDTLTGYTADQLLLVRVDAATLFKYIYQRNGSGSYVDAQYVLKLTRIVGPRYSAWDTEANVHKIADTGDLYDEASGLGFPVPQVLQDRIASIPVKAVKTRSNVADPYYIWGWLRKPTQISQESNGKYRISIEWWLELWSLYAYPAE